MPKIHVSSGNFEIDRGRETKFIPKDKKIINLGQVRNIKKENINKEETNEGIQHGENDMII